MMDKKIVAMFEMTLMVLAIFAFAYLMRDSDLIFENSEESNGANFFGVFLRKYFEATRTSIFTRVSAEEDEKVDWKQAVKDGGFFYEGEDLSVVDLSYGLGDIGCCSNSNEGLKCLITTGEKCSAEGIFAQGVSCSMTSFCKKGCCYDSDKGIYDKNVLQTDCPATWIDDANCNLPGARVGCCVLGMNTAYVTQGQCEIMTFNRALGDNAVLDWRADLNELQCVMLARNQKEGACVLEGGKCDFVTEGDCLAIGGQFSEGYLCTAATLDTNCEPTTETTCVESRDGVYFKDSCGNIANIYDSSRAEDPVYWENVIPLENSCGANSEIGNANSEVCGNCDRVMGGICASGIVNNFETNFGNYFCKDTSCEFEGKNYKSGESWCVYDGKIGDGDDVVGSRHWKYVCNQGEVQVEPCADYRNQICIQSNSFDIGGTEVDFSSAACVANNWRACININTEEDGLEKCEDTLNCQVQEIRIADKFRFDYCVPKYPGGFDLKSERYQESASGICGIATQTCTVIRKQKTTGGCKVVANKGCLSAGFAQQMNDWCTSLGDCGMSANIVGEYNENNYVVRKSPRLSSSLIGRLVSYATAVEGDYAEVEDYSEYLAAAGFGEVPEAPAVNPDEEESDGPIKMTHAMGIAGVGYAAGVYALYLAPSLSASFGLEGLSMVASGMEGLTAGSTANIAGFAQGMMGVGIGMIAGLYLAKTLGLSPIGSMLMAVGGAMVGYAIVVIGNIWNPVGWIGLVLIFVSFFFGGSKCKPIEVEFECKNWQAPRGGENCEVCNGDPLKPCSEYRCNSLGTSCELINKGTGEEMCIDGHRDDTSPPNIGPALGVIVDGAIYDDIKGNGFKVTSLDGGCVDAYTHLTFGITTDEPAICNFDMEQKDYDEMEYTFGGNYYKYNHTTTFVLPDPSHGESQGMEFSGDLKFYIKCSDVKGYETPTFYTVEMCINQGPDKTAPIVRATEPKNEGMVSFETVKQEISIFTNELSTCKWSLNDLSYDAMTNEMVCEDWRNYYGDDNDYDDNPEEYSEDFDYSTLGALEIPTKSVYGYTCKAEVPVSSSENKYYIKCKDQPWLEGTDLANDRNENSGFEFILNKPSGKIGIEWVEPDTDFEVATDYTTVNLEVKTVDGAHNHFCYFSFSNYENMILFFVTGSGRVHSQEFNRPAGSQKIYVECRDETGDFVRDEVNFNIVRKTSVPQIARVWESSGKIKFVTNEDAECKYSLKSCSFSWAQANDAGAGQTHTIDVLKGSSYYVKCKDAFGNVPNDCSIVVNAV